MGSTSSNGDGSPGPPTPSVFRWAFDLILAAVAALIFVLLYVTLPGNDHVGALLAIGVVALIFGLVAYLGRSISSAPGTAQAWALGFAGLGFGLLFLTLGLAPSSTIPFTNRIIGIVLVLVVLAVVVAGLGWGWRARASDANRSAERTAWAARTPVNALDYPSAGVSSPTAPSSPKDGASR